MSVPLDRLYHFIDNIAREARGDNVIIYRFYPHGSKKLQDLSPLLSNYHRNDHLFCPEIYCYDQEPLDYDFYDGQNLVTTKLTKLIEKYQLDFPKLNFQQYGCRVNIYDKSLLLHSEKKSKNVEKYRQNYFIPVYYWSHAIISRDWFRYAQHVDQNKHVEKLFLIFNRAWAGSREYRIKFSDLLITNNLLEFCNTRFNAIEPDLNIHYQQHLYQNSHWKPCNVLENYFDSNNAQSYYSADFDLSDYETSDIEVVLETLFDDHRWHLTEKIFRPIACGQPFILAATAESLEYLRNYGFKTFNSIWDESYDTITDPLERLTKIVQLMKEISQWDPETRHKKIQQAQQIAHYNKKYFFSQDFFSLIADELKTNLKSGLQELENTNTSKLWFDRRKKLCAIPEIKELIFDNGPNSKWPGKTKQQFLEPVIKARKYYLRSYNNK